MWTGFQKPARVWNTLLEMTSVRGEAPPAGVWTRDNDSGLVFCSTSFALCRLTPERHLNFAPLISNQPAGCNDD